MTRNRWMILEASIALFVLVCLVLVMLPKFLNSQVRVKVAESMQKQGELAQAIQALYQDRNVMLIDLWDDDTDLGHTILREEHFGVGDRMEQQRWMNDILKPLTTPVAYVEKLPEDPWKLESRRNTFVWPAENFDNPGAEGYLYIDNDPLLDQDGRYTMWQYGKIVYEGNLATDEAGEFLLIGLSPGWHPQNGSSGRRTGMAPPTLVQYDSSNGMYSRGEIMYHGRIENPVIPGKYSLGFQRQTGGF